MEEKLKDRINFIESIFSKMENKKSLIDVLKEEIRKLKALNLEYKAILNNKKVVHFDKKKGKTRYYLSDGSTYVINKHYKYLYDSNTKIITYEFENGQIERTFPCGLKEIRYNDGNIVIKNGDKDYEYIQKRDVSDRFNIGNN
ncbi:hypothetical protein EDEG_00053 [Edhazardia aedis USNM 41457]|uniref:Centromere protein J C-terminal domain-containing protein n=1 Tax=Edhazardia aedis (strain USNM 41457) TaxID=1003232 RepID=J9DD40_EDHAE|nr:hypothetical protein EDEG_00053 [Edhazardia aedis USNM 41457]|eukprot:EJW05389.1 hypothetical protein EDEG_00053 [Edhazardia aedis USNM 41457]